MINQLESNSECYPVEIQCQGGDDYGGIIIQEFNTEENKQRVNYTTTEQSEGGTNTELVEKSGMLEKQDNLELIPSIVMSQNESLQFTSSGQLLITDQATGDSFFVSLFSRLLLCQNIFGLFSDKLVSLNAQELLVETCLNNEQQVLIMPSMLETESISLYPNSTGVLENYIVTPVVMTKSSEISQSDVSSTVEVKRPQRHINNVEEEVGLCNKFILYSGPLKSVNIVFSFLSI